MRVFDDSTIQHCYQSIGFWERYTDFSHKKQQLLWVFW